MLRNAAVFSYPRKGGPEIFTLTRLAEFNTSTRAFFLLSHFLSYFSETLSYRTYLPFSDHGESRAVSAFQGLSIFWRRFVEQFLGDQFWNCQIPPLEKMAFLGGRKLTTQKWLKKTSKMTTKWVPKMNALCSANLVSVTITIHRTVNQAGKPRNGGGCF